MPVFKPTRPYPLPPNAEIVTDHGQRYYRPAKGERYKLTRDGTKYLKPAKKWYADIPDATGKLRRTPLSPNKDAAERMEKELRDRVEREKAGVKDPFAPHRKTPLATHVADWLAVLTARGRDSEYTALKKARVTAILDGCGFVFPGDLSAERLERFLE